MRPPAARCRSKVNADATARLGNALMSKGGEFRCPHLTGARSAHLTAPQHLAVNLHFGFGASSSGSLGGRRARGGVRQRQVGKQESGLSPRSSTFPDERTADHD